VDAVLGYTVGDPSWQIFMPNFLGGTRRKILWSIGMWPEEAGIDGMRAVAAGKRNLEFTRWATDILKSRFADRDPIYVRTTWEIGGEWFSWTAFAKQDPFAYRRAFQNFAASFHKVSNRFKIVWDFTGNRGPVEQWYPGDAACDVISQDIFWYPQWSSTDPFEAFMWSRRADRGLDWMKNFAAQHNKPMAISEWGVTGLQGDTGGVFIEEMKKWLDSNRVAYATYWNGTAASGYDGDLTLGRWPNTEATFKNVFGVIKRN
jgi:beta-mannanase